MPPRDTEPECVRYGGAGGFMIIGAETPLVDSVGYSLNLTLYHYNTKRKESQKSTLDNIMHLTK